MWEQLGPVHLESREGRVCAPCSLLSASVGTLILGSRFSPLLLQPAATHRAPGPTRTEYWERDLSFLTENEGVRSDELYVCPSDVDIDKVWDSLLMRLDNRHYKFLLLLQSMQDPAPSLSCIFQTTYGNIFPFHDAHDK